MPINSQGTSHGATVSQKISAEPIIRHRIGVSQLIGFVISRTFNRGQQSDKLVFKQSVTATLVPNPLRHVVSHSVTVASTIAKQQGKTDADAVGVAQTIHFAIDRKRVIADSLSFNQIVQAVLIRANQSAKAQEMSAFVNPTIATYFAGLTPGKIILNYQTTTLTLRKPEFGNKDTFNEERIYRTTRGLNLEEYKDPIWPTTEILEMNFSFLSEADAANLLSFLTLTLGKQISLYDHLGRHWTGFILNPNDDIVQKNVSNYTAKLTFQGTLA